MGKIGPNLVLSNMIFMPVLTLVISDRIMIKNATGQNGVPRGDLYLSVYIAQRSGNLSMFICFFYALRGHSSSTTESKEEW